MSDAKKRADVPRDRHDRTLEMDINRRLQTQSVSLADIVSGKTRALRVSEVATLLSVSARQVYKLTADHSIPCIKIGGSIRFDPASVADWLRQKVAVDSTNRQEKLGGGPDKGLQGGELCQIPSNR